MKEILVSIVGGRGLKYVFDKKPSKIIPFKGNFPLVPNYERIEYLQYIQNTQFLKDLPENIQSVVMKSDKMFLLENGFLEYLRERGINEETFLSFSNSEKSNKLLDWMNLDCIDFNQLNIK